MKILVVEDELTSRAIMQKIMAPYGTVHLCMDGAEAVEAFISSMDGCAPFDLVCMDYMMPGMDGLEALSRMRTAECARGIPPGRGVKVIMATATSTVETGYEDLAGMCDAVIHKPLRKDAFVNIMNRLGFTVRYGD